MTGFRAASAVIGGSSAISSGTIVVPAGVTTSDFGIIVLTWAGSAANETQTPTATGWASPPSPYAPTACQNMGFAVLIRNGGHVAGDNILVSWTSRASTLQAFWYDNNGAGLDVCSVVTSRAGASSLNSVLAGVTTTAATEMLIAIMGERSTASGTTPSSWSGTSFTQDSFYENTAGSTCSIYAGHATKATAGATGTSTLTYTGGAASGNSGTLLLALQPAIPTPPTPTVYFSMVPRLDTDYVQAGLSASSLTSAQLYASTSPSMTSPIAGSIGTPSAAGWATSTVSGLTAGTKYYLAWKLNGGSISAVAHTATTLKTGPLSYVADTGSCQTNDGNPTVFTQVLADDPAFFIHQGDIHYQNTNVEATWRTAMTTALTKTRLATLLASVPFDYVYDNHDWAGQGSYSGSWTGGVSPATMWRELAGHYPATTTTELFHTFVHGRVRWIKLDQWTTRAVGSDLGGTTADKCMSTEQENWLYDTLTAASEPVIVLISAWPMSPIVGQGRWASFPEQTARIKAWITARPSIMARMVAVGGDSHSIQGDTGANANALGHFPSLNASAILQNTGDEAGTWDIGNTRTPGADLTGNTTGDGVYSRLTITDEGGPIGFLWEAVSQDGTTVMSQAMTFNDPGHGVAVGTITWTGHATGHAPTIAARHGTAAGTISWHGFATGHAPVVGGKSGHAIGAITWAGHAVGHRPGTGTATITATAEPDNVPPRVRLDLAGFAPATTVTVTRIDPSGNQTPVRSFDPKTLSGGGAVDYDQDAPFLQTVTYVATPNSGPPVTSGPVTLLVYVPWLFHATIPSLSMPLEEMWQGDPVYATARGLQYAIGRPAAVPTSDGTRRAATYDLMIRTAGLNEMNALATLLADSSVLLLQGAFEGQTRTIYEWLDVGDVTPAALIGGFPDDPYLQWTLPVAETDPPVGTIQAQFTYNDLHAQFDSYTDLRTAFASYRDLATDTMVGT